MKRRAFIAGLGAAAAWPVTARAQESTTIGFLSSSSPHLFDARVRAFRQGLSESGFAGGPGLSIEFRWADGRNEQLKDFAAEFVRRRVSVILASGEPAAVAAKEATTTIPIVFVGGSDPVRLGLVGSLSRPDGNITGTTVLNATMAPKRLQLLKELVPSARLVAALLDSSSPSTVDQAKELPTAASALGLKVEILRVDSEHEVAAILEGAGRPRADAFLIGSSARFNGLSERLGALSSRHKVAAIYQSREFVSAGGLASYGASTPDAYRTAGVYSGRLLKGAKPADLPIQQATRVELIINLKTAKTLGLEVPLTLLGRADEVIE
jgi:putative tryptophan/tyrosine transport system substrate-binding protein